MFTDVEEFQHALAANGLTARGSEPSGPLTFHARLVAVDLGPLRLVELETPTGECLRDAGRSARGDEAVWQIDLVTRGRARVEQGRAVADLGPGDMVLIDPGLPSHVTSTACTHISMLVPRHVVRLRAEESARLVGIRFAGDRGPAALVSAAVKDMGTTLTGMAAVEAQRSGEALTELISAAVESQLGARDPGPDEVLRAGILRHIERRLGDRDLGPVAIAAAHHISVRHLHRLFENQPVGVAALIRQRRLQRCRAEIARSDQTVAAVAARWGFPDPSHFSRLFKATYGQTAASLTVNGRARKSKASARVADDNGRLPVRER